MRSHAECGNEKWRDHLHGAERDRAVISLLFPTDSGERDSAYGPGFRVSGRDDLVQYQTGGDSEADHFRMSPSVKTVAHLERQSFVKLSSHQFVPDSPAFSKNISRKYFRMRRT